MSLLSNAMERCILLDRRTTPDGYGGYISTWTDGAEFNAAIVQNTSLAVQIAQVQGAIEEYTVTTSKTINLQVNDVFRRASDGKIFKVTSDGDDKKTPNSAALNMRQVNAKETTLG